MWICEKCNEEIEDNFKDCWKCTKESDVIEKIDRENLEKPDLNTLIKEEAKKSKTKYRAWQNVCFLIFGTFGFLYLLGGQIRFLIVTIVLIIIVSLIGKK